MFVCLYILLYLDKIFKQLVAKCFQVLLPLNIEIFCKVEMSMKYFF